MDTLTAVDVNRAITAGLLDDNLDTMSALIRQRQVGTRQQKLHSIAAGARGRLTGCRPLYLNGAPFTVEKAAQTRFHVRLDDAWLAAHPQATKWRGTVTVPPSMCDFTNPPEA